MTRALAGSTSAAKWATKSSSGRHAKRRRSGRAVRPGQHLAQPRNVSGQRGLWELRRGDVVAVGLQAVDDRAPAGAVGPRAVHKDDVRPDAHQWFLPGQPPSGPAITERLNSLSLCDVDAIVHLRVLGWLSRARERARSCGTGSKPDSTLPALAPQPRPRSSFSIRHSRQHLAFGQGPQPSGRGPWKVTAAPTGRNTRRGHPPAGRKSPPDTSASASPGARRLRAAVLIPGSGSPRLALLL